MSRNDNKSRMMSDHTTSSERKVVNGSVYWNNYSGTKASHNRQANQINIKDTSTGDHIFYNTQTGVQGVAGGNRKK